MAGNNIFAVTDLTLLKKDATPEDFIQLTERAEKLEAYSVCVPPANVRFCHNLLVGKSPNVCTVIGFPNGYSTLATKIFEIKEAIKNGANEVDVVLNIENIKSGCWDEVAKEAAFIKQTSSVPVKAIIETCLLTDEEIQKTIDILELSFIDFVKTSTGFDKAGADIDTVRMMSDYIKKNSYDIKIMASGGIKTIMDAQEFITAGASRIGASNLI